MSLLFYQSQVVVSIFVVLFIGSVLLLLARRRSAASKQFICSVTILSSLAVGLVPFLPMEARPSLPANFPTTAAFQATLEKSIPHKLAPVILAPTPDERSSSSFSPWPMITGLTLVVSLVLGLRLICSLLAVCWMRRKSVSSDSRIQALSARRIKLLDRLSSPIAMGGFRPMILLPTEALNWPEDQLRAVIIHEEAHLNNCDPNWQILAEIVCILYWFNPLAWLIRGLMRDSAERSADDAVIRAGIQPSAYAQDLIAIATRIGRDRQSIAWTTFARKNGVKGRIHAILNTKLERNPMKKSLKMAAVVGLTLSALYTSAKVGDKASVASLLPDGLINPGSGDQIGDFPSSSKKSVPATKSNGFVGKLADGRPVEVLQICRMLPNKSFQAWKPDGTPLAPDKSNPLRLSPLSFRGPNVRCIFLRFKGTPQNPMPTSGCHKLLDNGNEANQNEKGFLGSEYYFLNGGFAAYQDGYYTTATFFTLNKTSGKAFSARFGVQDTGWTDLGPIKRSDPKFNNVNIMEVRGPLEVELEYYPWWTQHPAPYTMLQFDLKLSNYLPMFPNVSDNTRGNLQVVPVFRKSGLKDELSNRMYSPGVSSIVLTPTTHKLVSYRSKYYFAYRTTDIKEFRIVRRNLLGCDLLKVAVNPNR